MNLEATPEARLARMLISLEGLAVGDALGNHHGNNVRKREAALWEFSDDTLMAASIVANLRQYEQIEQDKLVEDFARRWDGNRGYGQGVTRLLKSIKQGARWSEAAFAMFDGQGSYGNGAAMRVAPLGAYFADDIEQVVEQAKLSAEVTHAHPEGVVGAVAVAVAAALACQFRARGESPSQKKFLEAILPFVQAGAVQSKLQEAVALPENISVQDAAKTLGNGRPSIAQTTVPFSLWAATRFLSDFQRAIQQTAAVKGDVDTTCAIVGGIVVCYTGLEGIPAEWVKRREALPDWAFEE